MMNFIRTCRVPGKSDCDGCLKSEPLHLKDRVWKAIKFYVKKKIECLYTHYTNYIVFTTI